MIKKLRQKLEMAEYKMTHAAFRWVMDEDGDIGIEIFRLVTLLKYKEHTIIKFGKKYENAPKYIR